MDQNKFVYFVNIVSPLDMLKMTLNGFYDVKPARKALYGFIKCWASLKY